MKAWRSGFLRKHETNYIGRPGAGRKGKNMLEGIFKIEVITEGQFVDCGYLIKMVVIRVNPDAMNEYISSGVLNTRDVYETTEEWNAYKEEKAKRRQEWERKVAEKLGIVEGEVDSLVISQSLSEIFTVVYMSKENQD